MMLGMLLIGDIFRNAAQAVPHQMAAALGDDSLTFAEIDRRSDQVGAVLRDLGVDYQDRVVTWSGTHLDIVPVFAAAAKVGAVFAPANALLGIDEAVEMVGSARPALLVVDDAHADDGHVVGERTGVTTITVAELTDRARSVEVAPVDEPMLRETDTHVLFFTSGSTGRSKGVMLSHRVNYLRTHPGSQLEPRGAKICMFPLFHMGAWTIALTSWQNRAPVVFVESTDGASLVEAVEAHRATHINCIPAVWQRILDHLATPEGRDRDMSSIRIVDSGTSATPPELLRALSVAFPHATRRVFYGSTEAGAVTLLTDAAMDDKPGSCGVVSHSATVRVSPETGEVQVRGPLLFDGYFDDPDATAEALVDGWFHTGDVAAVDNDGFISIVGRVKDVIRTGGESVSPSEVETALADHPAIRDVAIVGLPDPRWGETVCAAVVVDGEPPSVDDLRDHTSGRLASFKQPRRVEVVDEIPRTPATNQIQRRRVIEAIEDRA